MICLGLNKILTNFKAHKERKIFLSRCMLVSVRLLMALERCPDLKSTKRNKANAKQDELPAAKSHMLMPLSWMD